jgi:hypothetical protein
MAEFYCSGGSGLASGPLSTHSSNSSVLIFRTRSFIAETTCSRSDAILFSRVFMLNAKLCHLLSLKGLQIMRPNVSTFVSGIGSLYPSEYSVRAVRQLYCAARI